MSITITVVGGVSPVQVVAPTTPRHHTSLLTQTRTLLQHHLPMLGTWGVGPFNIQLLVNTIIAGQQQSQQEQAKAHVEQQQKESDTIERLLGPRNFSPLLQYCGATLESQPPSPLVYSGQGKLQGSLGHFPREGCRQIYYNGSQLQTVQTPIFTRSPRSLPCNKP